MEIDVILEIIKTNPACYFVAGLVVGYFLRGLALFGFPASRNKRPSRYQTKKGASPAVKSRVVADFSEPSVELSDLTVKAFTLPRVGAISLDQHRNEFQ